MHPTHRGSGKRQAKKMRNAAAMRQLRKKSMKKHSPRHQRCKWRECAIQSSYVSGFRSPSRLSVSLSLCLCPCLSRSRSRTLPYSLFTFALSSPLSPHPCQSLSLSLRLPCAPALPAPAGLQPSAALHSLAPAGDRQPAGDEAFRPATPAGASGPKCGRVESVWGECTLQAESALNSTFLDSNRKLWRPMKLITC
jgi:hypothetical protein